MARTARTDAVATNQITHGDALAVLKQLPSDFVDCIVYEFLDLRDSFIEVVANDNGLLRTAVVAENRDCGIPLFGLLN